MQSSVLCKTLRKKLSLYDQSLLVLKERITIMGGLNEAVTDRLPLVVTGKSKKPHCFTNVSNLPVLYNNQRSSCMDM